MESIERRCRTCRYFEPSPLEGKGWCRCPILFTPTNQHLVDGADLDCRRAFGDYWQPIAAEGQPAAADADQVTPRQPMPPVEGGTTGGWLAGPPPLTGARSSPRAAVSPLTRPVPPPPARVSLPSRRGQLVLVGLAILVVITVAPWLSQAWAGPRLPEPVTKRPIATSVAVVATTTPAPAASPASTTAPPAVASAPATATPAQPAPTVTVAPVATAAPPSGAGPAPSVAPTTPPAPTAAPTARPAAPTAATTPGQLRVGGTATVDTGDPTLRLRVRQTPSLEATIIGRISNGQTISLLDGPRSADGHSWWQVRQGDVSGWVAGSFLIPPAR